MIDTYFNLEKPIEKAVYERIKMYALSGKDYDTVFEMIGRDFPNLDSSILDTCHTTAFLHYFAGDGEKAAGIVKQVNLLHSDSVGKPFYSHVSRDFNLREGKDVVAAIMVENPLYLYANADVHLSIYVEGNKTNEFKHTMDMGDRRNVYYIPLNIRQGISMDRDADELIQIFVMNEKIEGQFYGEVLTASFRECDAQDALIPDRFTLVDQEDSVITDGYDIKDLKYMEIHASVRKNRQVVGSIFESEGTIVFSPCDTEDRRFDLIVPIRLRTSDSDSDLLVGYTTILNTVKAAIDHEVPHYELKAGKYSIQLRIWDSLIWSDEITLTGEIPVKNEAQAKVEAPTDNDDVICEPDVFDKLAEEIEEFAAVIDQREAEQKDIDPKELVKVLGLNLFNVNNHRDDPSLCVMNFSSYPQTGFNAEDLKMLSVIGKLKSVKSPDILESSMNFSWTLYDDTGRLVDTHPACKEVMAGEVWLCTAFGDFCQQKWPKGSYRLELLYNDTTLISAIFKVGDIDVSSEYEPRMITKKHEAATDTAEGNSLARLEKMAGLKSVKEKVHSLMNFYKFQQQREAAGLPGKKPALHARFLGNPGTGKTTVARLLGQIYKEMGLLSSGHVVLEERKNMLGRFYDSESQAIENALNRAKGGILLIDEAYNLYVESDDKDPGRRILEYLLTALSDENNRDWMLILAGYPNEMEKMLQSNPGIESRVNEKFYFDDLNVDELMEVAELYCDDNKFELSDEARERLKSVITRDVANKTRNFGNGRYANRLMDTAINTRMASRLSKIASPTYDQLVTIEADDIPISAEEAQRISCDGFDDAVIDDALKRLDSLVGMNKVKSAIHNFVNVSRYLQSQGEKIRGKGLLKWNFTGNTGTGKSTVAQILADILKGMNLVQNNDVTEVKGEEIFNVSDYECNEVIRAAVKRSRRGVLFIDGDAPEFRSSQYRMTSEQVRFKLASLASEDNASGALIIAECASSNLSMAHSLAANGVYDFDHTFIFDDYTADELYDILLQCLGKMKTSMSQEAETIIREYIGNLCDNRDMSFANARTMKNLSRAIFETMIVRLSSIGDPDAERIVQACDVESFVWKRPSGKIGF